MQKSKKIKLILLSIFIIILFVTCIFCIKNKQQKKELEEKKQQIMQYTKMSDFKNIEEVCMYLDIDYINQIECTEENIDYLINVKLKNELNNANKNYYENLIQYSASALQYKNFYIVDSEKNINILVLCDQSKQNVTDYYINGTKFYFDVNKTKEQILDYKKISTIDIDNIKLSNELEQIILNNWQTTNIDIGTKETTYKNYDIYFDEGLEIKKIEGKIFNLVFTKNYEKNIIKDINVKSDFFTIINTFGEPTFQASNVIGYKTSKFYIFFSDKEVSVYPIINYESDKIMEIIENYKDTKDINKYLNEIRIQWPDYNVYECSDSHEIIEYALKGIKFNYNNSSNRGVIIYNNYSGKINNKNFEEIIKNKEDFPENMYFINQDLVFITEKNRIYGLDDYTPNHNFAIEPVINTSSRFKVNVLNNKVFFVSINKECPNSELREMINYGLWKDDFNFIYSISGRGIYKYDAEKRTYMTIIEGNENYILSKIENNKLYYDEKSIDL